MSKAKAIHLPTLDEDISSQVDPILPIQELFTVSPFGLGGSRQCRDSITIQIDERCIYSAISKSMVWTAGLQLSLLF
jgi:hypothetical protein